MVGTFFGINGKEDVHTYNTLVLNLGLYDFQYW